MWHSHMTDMAPGGSPEPGRPASSKREQEETPTCAGSDSIIQNPGAHSGGVTEGKELALGAEGRPIGQDSPYAAGP